jgi:endonuclease/exonuclease/phosphatase family metal-dependent hydrolase
MPETVADNRVRLAFAGMVLLLAFGCAVAPAFEPEAEEIAALAPSAPPREIKILTINAWSGLTYEGFFSVGRCNEEPGQRYELLVEGIRGCAPDLIAVQEANPLPAYAERLAADLDYRVIYRVALGGIRFGPCGIPWNLREGDALLVKKPATLEDLGRKKLCGGGIATNWFCFHFGEITQVLLGRTVVNGKPLYVYVVHLHAGPCRGPALDAAMERLTREVSPEQVAEARAAVEEDIVRRAEELAVLKAFIADTLPAEMPAIILGDFNTTVESGELTPLLGEGGWQDTFALENARDGGATWGGVDNPHVARGDEAPSDPYARLCFYHDRSPYRIDLILMNDKIPRDRVLESHVVLTPENGRAPSDHYGVLTTLWW